MPRDRRSALRKVGPHAVPIPSAWWPTVPSRDKFSAGTGDRLELYEHAVDEALDGARGLEPKAQQDRIDPVALGDPQLERFDRLGQRLVLRVQHRSRVDAVPLGEDELEQQHRPALANVLDRLEEPLRDGALPGRRRAEDRAVGPAGTGLVPGGEDQ